jgi:hypothetical protein
MKEYFALMKYESVKLGFNLCWVWGYHCLVRFRINLWRCGIFKTKKTKKKTYGGAVKLWR